MTYPRSRRLDLRLHGIEQQLGARWTPTPDPLDESMAEFRLLDEELGKDASPYDRRRTAVVAGWLRPPTMDSILPTAPHMWRGRHGV